MGEQVVTANEEAVNAWDGVLFDRWLEWRHLVIPGIAKHSDLAIEVTRPAPGERVVDLGCGLGETTQQLAELVGPEGSVTGVDSGQRFVEECRSENERDNVSFELADIEAGGFGQDYDLAFSRFGVMFFNNPVAAMRNVRDAVVPGGRLAAVVWRNKLDNAFFHVSEQVVEGMVEEDPDSDELTCGPGPFSMANADTTSGVLQSAGWDEVTLQRCDRDYPIGRDMDEAVRYMMGLGPAAEHLRLAGGEAVRMEPEIKTALADALRQYETESGEVMTTMSTWIVTATNPG